MEEVEVQLVKRRRWPRRLGIALGLLLALLLAALVIVWVMRVRLASEYIDRELARRGVQASYDVKRIGFGSQILENLVIGNPGLGRLIQSARSVGNNLSLYALVVVAGIPINWQLAVQGVVLVAATAIQGMRGHLLSR